MPAEAASRDGVPPAGPAPDGMRAAMGRFATGVTVVTGQDADGPAGFACQSFASVSLDPPLVLFCADHRGRAWPRIRTAGRFCVNVLTAEQAEMCTRFGSSRGRKFEGLPWTLSEWGTPSLPQVLLRVHAQVWSVQSAGDHDVVTGRVLALEHDAEAGTAPDGEPMIFYRGAFGLQQPALPDGPPLTWGWGDNWG